MLKIFNLSTTIINNNKSTFILQSLPLADSMYKLAYSTYSILTRYTLCYGVCIYMYMYVQSNAQHCCARTGPAT